LIDEAEIPKSYIQYLTYVALWDPLLKRDPPVIPPYEEEGFEEGTYPRQFEEDIEATFKKLEKERGELLQV
jgi:hypothetical protein